MPTLKSSDLLYTEIDGLKCFYQNEASFRFVWNEVFLENSYHFESRRPDPLIIDCGSNVGLSTLFFKRLYPKARIISFEPHRLNFEILKLNVSTNQLKDVELIEAAVSASGLNRCDFWSNFNRAGDTLGGTIIQELSDQPCFTKEIVSSVSLSNFINQPVDFLKLDIEGAELDVLREIEEKLNLVREIFVEVHVIKKDLLKITEIEALLQKNGFLVNHYEPVFNEEDGIEFLNWSEASGITVSCIRAIKDD